MAPSIRPFCPGRVMTFRLMAFFLPVVGQPRLSWTELLPFFLVSGSSWEQMALNRLSL